MTGTAGGTQRAAGFVLAGGESRRMGRDKALLSFCGRPLVENALGILREAGLEARIAGSRSALGEFAPVVADAEPGLGPLGGVCAALAASCAERALFLPVDLPLLPASLIAFLLFRAEITGCVVTVPTAAGFAQTFPAVLDRAVLPGLEAELEAGRLGCFAAFHAVAAELRQAVAAVPAELLAQSGHAAHPAGLPAALWFVNANTPADLRRAEAHLACRFA